VSRDLNVELVKCTCDHWVVHPRNGYEGCKSSEAQARWDMSFIYGIDGETGVAPLIEECNRYALRSARCPYYTYAGKLDLDVILGLA